MRTITILYDGTNYTRAWLNALVWAREQFIEAGYEICFWGREDFSPRGVYEEIPLSIDDIYRNSFDIVFCAFHDLGFIGDKDTQKEILIELRKHSNKIIWLDMEDSTAKCNFSLIPYVDRYLKGQMFKDMELYKKGLYAGRIWCDYYYRELGIKNEKYKVEDPCISEDIDVDKIGLSWNFGLGKPSFELEKKDADINRSIDVFYRGSTFESITHLQRKFTTEKILELNNISIVDPTVRVSKEMFVRELYDSRSVISPFGWGELCYKDYEAFVAGAALIKPSVSHIRTFPNYYIDNETYYSLNWDYSNFEEVVDTIMCKQKALEVATEGQNRYLALSRGVKAKENFVKHVIAECEL